MKGLLLLCLPSEELRPARKFFPFVSMAAGIWFNILTIPFLRMMMPGLFVTLGGTNAFYLLPLSLSFSINV